MIYTFQAYMSHLYMPCVTSHLNSQQPLMVPRSPFLLLQSLVDIIKHGLTDENQKVKTITSLSIAALAEAAAPYGIESFDDVLEPLWKGIRLLRYNSAGTTDLQCCRDRNTFYTCNKASTAL